MDALQNDNGNIIFSGFKLDMAYPIWPYEYVNKSSNANLSSDFIIRIYHIRNVERYIISEMYMYIVGIDLK